MFVINPTSTYITIVSLKSDVYIKGKPKKPLNLNKQLTVVMENKPE